MMKGGGENRKSESEDPLRIWMMVEHNPDLDLEWSHSIYKLNLSSDAENLGPNPKEISPSMKISGELAAEPAMAKLGSKILLIGGIDLPLDYRKQKRTFIIDTDDESLRPAAPMNYPKAHPCMFTADGMIYVLSAHGRFERYNVSLNKWKQLARPLESLLRLVKWDQPDSDCATVVDRNVFIGGRGGMCMTFNLDTQEWCTELVPAPFTCGSLFVNGSFYCLRGHDVWLTCSGVYPLPGSNSNRKSRVMGSLGIVKTDFNGSNVEVMAPPSDLDDGLFTGNDYYPWRQVLHLYGNFFCYVTAFKSMLGGRGCFVFLKIFEEVFGANANNKSRSHFRSLASFSYRLASYPYSIRCCASGTVPKSWIEGTHKQKYLPLDVGSFGPEKSNNKYLAVDNREGLQGDIIATEDAIVIELRAELARKDELLKRLLAERVVPGHQVNAAADLFV